MNIYRVQIFNESYRNHRVGMFYVGAGKPETAVTRASKKQRRVPGKFPRHVRYQVRMICAGMDQETFDLYRKLFPIHDIDDRESAQRIREAVATEVAKKLNPSQTKSIEFDMMTLR